MGLDCRATAEAEAVHAAGCLQPRLPDREIDVSQYENHRCCDAARFFMAKDRLPHHEIVNVSL
jgi:hypothetical protein